MTEKLKKQEETVSLIDVTVTHEGGVEFAGKHYKQGEKIRCTEAQKVILAKQGVI